MKFPSDSIETFSGKRFRPMDPSPDTICVEDIAHSLGNKCRYTGHTKRFYSVAEHSIHLALYMELEYDDPWLAYAALMHDAHEAYFPDVAYPIKQHLPHLVEMENKLQKMIFKKFLVPWPVPAVVDAADRRIVADEAKALMRTHGVDWNHHPDGGLGVNIKGYNNGSEYGAGRDWKFNFHRLHHRMEEHDGR